MNICNTIAQLAGYVVAPRVGPGGCMDLFSLLCVLLGTAGNASEKLGVLPWNVLADCVNHFSHSSLIRRTVAAKPFRA